MNNAIVVGATSGLGRALAEMLAADGWRTGITGRRTDLLASLQASSSDRFIARAVDIARTDETIRGLEELIAGLEGLDLLILSAGTGDINEPLDNAVEQRTIDTNVTGFTAVADWGFNYFRRQGHGHFAAITSIGGLRGSREAPAYNATKAYQINYLEGLRQKAAHLKLPITVTDIRPGPVDTAMAKGEGLFWVMPVDRAARQICRAIEKRKEVVHVTKRWAVVARLLKFMPDCIYGRM